VLKDSVRVCIVVSLSCVLKDSVCIVVRFFQELCVERQCVCVCIVVS